MTGGVLAIWQDCAEGRVADIERWYQTEHVAERVAVPGFRRGRRCEAVEARQRYFTWYETDAPEVLVSPAYRARLDNPTPLTREIMSDVMLNMSRTICRRARLIGAFRGANACAIRLDAALGPDLADLPDVLAQAPGVARVEYWTAAEEIATPVSEEERLRGGDARIAACLLVETLREAEARSVAGIAGAALGGRVIDIGVYRLLCELEK